MRGATTQMGSSCGSQFFPLQNEEKANYISLQDIPFCTWDGWGADAKSTGTAGCAWVIGESTGLPYGDSGVINYADLSNYSKLIITATDGVPRILLNRDFAEGTFSADESQSHLIEFPKAGTWVDKYFSTAAGENEGETVYTVDLKQIVKDKGFAHLHAIKGANWGNVTVTGMYLYVEGKVTEKSATVYVQAENAPFLYSWYMVDNVAEQPLGIWPGTQMTETEVVQGVTFWKMTVTTPDDISSFNIIFNNGMGGQTEDILGISSDRFFTYDGYSGYIDISELFVEVPNAEITQVEIRGDFNGWEEGGSSVMTKGEGNVYTMQLNLVNNEKDQQFKLVVNGSLYGGIESVINIDAPEGWVEVFGAGTIEETGYFILRHSITNYESYVLTATWEENPNAIDGWTLKVEGKDYKYELIDMQEWQVMAAWYASVGQGTGWSKPWDFSSATPSTKTLPGVTAIDGHVDGIDLSNNQMAGTFPYALLALPMLKSLNLSGNHLTGDLGVTTYAFAQKNPTMMTQLQELNISGNQFSGNVGLLANSFSSLTSLNASNNCFEDVYPMIPTTVTTLNLSHQTISRVVPLHLAKLSVADIATKVPSILIYDHANQTFTPNINLMCTTADNSWGMMMAYQNGQLAVPYVSNQNTYYGEKGDTLKVSVYNNNGIPEGSTFRISLSFDEGDGNFDGQVNVLDLQANILYIMEKYLTRPYNFTAANLWKDYLINVQDVICLVNQLMATEQEQAQTAHARRYAPSSVGASDASVYLQDGKLMLNSIWPVAAFDLLLNGTNSLSVANYLERMGMTFVTKKQADGLHVIAYSMNGACIPSGTTAIGSVDSNAATISNAMLSDSEANAITVSFSGTTTGIETISSSANIEQTIYDLQGRKVRTTSRKGLYIKNGQKILE